MPSYVQQSSLSHRRDSLELASLASSSLTARTSLESTSSPEGVSSSRKLSLEVEDPLNTQGRTSDIGRGVHGRSFSMSSAFDFTSNLFPLSSTAGNGYAPIGTQISASDPHAGIGGGSLEKHKNLTYLNGLSLVVGVIIGSGIFSSPGQVVARVGSPGASLVVWLLAGILAWTGAASYAELGGAIPLNGGSQIYLSKIYGEVAGFLFTWCAVLVLKPGSTAIISIIFGEYFVRAIVGAEAEHVSSWVNKGVALLGLLAATLFNAISTKLGIKISDMFLFLKFVALVGVTVIGIVVAATGFSTTGEANQDWKMNDWFQNTSHDVSSWAVALYSGLWAFDGWDNTNYVVGEFRNYSRDLPRVIHTAMPLVILFYIMANVAYFLVLPFSVIDSSNTVAVMFGSQVFGPIGSLIFALMVSSSCFGTLNATTFTGARLVYSAAKEGFLPELFGKIGIGVNAEPSMSSLRTRSWVSKSLARLFGDSDTGLFFTPVNAMILNALVASCYILVGEFGTLVTFYGVAGYTFYFFTVLGLVILRVKEPFLERTYRTWILNPIIFCCVSLFLTSRAIFAQPVQAAIVILFIVAGVPVYYWRVRGRDKAPKEHGDPIPWWKFWKKI